MTRAHVVAHRCVQFWVCLLGLLTGFALYGHPRPPSSWIHSSSESGDVPAPTLEGSRQPDVQVLDADSNGIMDFVVASNRVENGIVLYRRLKGEWIVSVVEEEPLVLEAGGTVFDVDSDGDPDLVLGGKGSERRLFWWENPRPDGPVDAPWVRRTIREDGAPRMHDIAFGDVDDDGRAELLFWNQGTKGNPVNDLFLGEIPADPHASQPWSLTRIYDGDRDSEGLDLADIDRDGDLDIVGGGHWFEHDPTTGAYIPHVLDLTLSGGRHRVADLIPGGRLEVVLGSGDSNTALEWLEWDGSEWQIHPLVDGVWYQGHTLDVGDVNGDGHMDIFAAEMYSGDGSGQGDQARMLMFYGDGTGQFLRQSITTGIDNHESKLADVDGDGFLDIVGKPWSKGTPGIHLWVNDPEQIGVDQWQLTSIDDEIPYRSVFVRSADVDGDGLDDIVAGGWWYRNPGPGGVEWQRRTIGAPLNQLAVVHDFDSDGDPDVLGTKGIGSESNADLVWARNDGGGDFTVIDNVSDGTGNFLQGATSATFTPDGPMEVALSWHDGGDGIEMLTVPDDPATEQWPIRVISTQTLGEDLSAGDIDRDGDLDLLLGLAWLENTGEGWVYHVLNNNSALLDRNELADIDGDGRLDAVVGFEPSPPHPIAWYRQPVDPTELWQENIVFDVFASQSLDVADLDRDGDLDLVAGEHRKLDPDNAATFILENVDGVGGVWTEHRIGLGEEHHDGTQVADLDHDADLDIYSIGWVNPRVLVYENGAIELPTDTVPPVVFRDGFER